MNDSLYDARRVLEAWTEPFIGRMIMDSSKEASKAAKKAAKAEVKRQKKLKPDGTVSAAAGAPPAASTTVPESSGPSPSERSAEAAERQVGLQRWRVTIAIITLLVALASLVYAIKPWRNSESVKSHSNTSQAQPSGD